MAALLLASVLAMALLGAGLGVGRSGVSPVAGASGAAPQPVASVVLPEPTVLATGEGAALPVPSTARDTIKLPDGQSKSGQVGYLQVISDREGVVYVDDVRKSTTDDPRLIERTAGRHRVRVVAGLRSRSQDVRVDAGRSNSALVRFNP